MLIDTGDLSVADVSVKAAVFQTLKQLHVFLFYVSLWTLPDWPYFDWTLCFEALDVIAPGWTIFTDFIAAGFLDFDRGTVGILGLRQKEILWLHWLGFLWWPNLIKLGHVSFMRYLFLTHLPLPNPEQCFLMAHSGLIFVCFSHIRCLTVCPISQFVTLDFCWVFFTCSSIAVKWEIIHSLMTIDTNHGEEDRLTLPSASLELATACSSISMAVNTL